jgi:hypothetical protein
MKAQRGHSGRIEVKKGKDVLDGLKATWRQVFQQACEFDGFERDTSFCIFSETNPFAPFIDRAAQEYFRAVQEYQAGGYVGLSLGGKP